MKKNWLNKSMIATVAVAMAFGLLSTGKLHAETENTEAGNPEATVQMIENTQNEDSKESPLKEEEPAQNTEDVQKKGSSLKDRIVKKSQAVSTVKKQIEQNQEANKTEENTPTVADKVKGTQKKTNSDIVKMPSDYGMFPASKAGTQKKLTFPGQSEYVDVSYTSHQENWYYTFDVTYTIREDAEGEIIIDLSKVNEMMEKEMDWLSPGDYINFNYKIVNKSNVKYKYKDQSFVLTPSETANVEGLSDVIGFDGQNIPLSHTSSRMPNPAIQALYGRSSELDVTVDDLLGTLYKLENDGWNGKKYSGPNALSEFYIDYLNEHPTSDMTEKVTDLNSLPYQAVCMIYKGKSNGIKTVNAATRDNLKEKYGNYYDKYVREEKVSYGYKLQVVESEADIASLSYYVFHRDLLNFGFGDEMVANMMKKKPNFMFTNYGVTHYMDKEAAYSEANAYFDKLFNTKALNKGEDVMFPAIFGLEGEMDNAWQNYSFGWYNTITLEPAETPTGKIQVNKTIDKENTDFSLGDPIFVLKAENTETKEAFYKYVRFTEDKSNTQTVVFDNLPVGNYKVTELMGIRYDFANVSVESKDNCAKVDGQSVIVDLNASVVNEQPSANITFSNVEVNDKYLSDTDTVVNRFKVTNGEVSSVTQDYLK